MLKYYHNINYIYFLFFTFLNTNICFISLCKIEVERAVGIKLFFFNDSSFIDVLSVLSGIDHVSSASVSNKKICIICIRYIVQMAIGIDEGENTLWWTVFYLTSGSRPHLYHKCCTKGGAIITSLIIFLLSPIIAFVETVYSIFVSVICWNDLFSNKYIRQHLLHLIYIFVFCAG